MNGQCGVSLPVSGPIPIPKQPVELIIRYPRGLQMAPNVNLRVELNDEAKNPSLCLNPESNTQWNELDWSHISYKPEDPKQIQKENKQQHLQPCNGISQVYKLAANPVIVVYMNPVISCPNCTYKMDAIRKLQGGVQECVARLFEKSREQVEVQVEPKALCCDAKCTRKH